MNAALSLREKETRTRKNALRIAMRAARRQLSQAHVRDASRRACAHLLTMSEVCSARVVAVYSAIRQEIDPSAAVEALWQRGQTVVFPRVVEGERTLRFHAVATRAQLAPGTLGIPSPTDACPEVPLKAIEAVVVPGLAFDAHGRRLGWGGGFYDATLAACPGLRIGLAYHTQLVERVPADERDLPMDYLVTDAGIRAIAQQPSNQTAPGRGAQDTE